MAAERIAVVGSRDNPPLEKVKEFLTWLHGAHPESVVVSGGARGVDKCAESFWLSTGGSVVSYRPGRDRRFKNDSVYLVEKWHLAPSGSRIEHLYHEPHFDDYKSALWYRNLLIASDCDRLVAFMRRGGSHGTRITIELARAEGVEIHEVEG